MITKPLKGGFFCNRSRRARTGLWKVLELGWQAVMKGYRGPMPLVYLQPRAVRCQGMQLKGSSNSLLTIQAAMRLSLRTGNIGDCLPRRIITWVHSDLWPNT